MRYLVRFDEVEAIPEKPKTRQGEQHRLNHGTAIVVVQRMFTTHCVIGDTIFDPSSVPVPPVHREDVHVVAVCRDARHEVVRARLLSPHVVRVDGVRHDGDSWPARRSSGQVSGRRSVEGHSIKTASAA